MALQGDGRAVALTLTDAGPDLAAGAARYQRAVFEEATRGWADADHVAFARLFARFAEGVAAMLAETERATRQRGANDGVGTNDESGNLAPVAAWHDALNAGDAERVAALAHDAAELAGPKGDATGKNLLHDWEVHAGVRLEPLRWFARDGRIVVEQRAAWRDPQTGAFGEPAAVATVFLVGGGLLRSIARYDGLAAALADAGLDAARDALPSADATADNVEG